MNYRNVSNSIDDHCSSDEMEEGEISDSSDDCHNNVEDVCAEFKKRLEEHHSSSDDETDHDELKIVQPPKIRNKEWKKSKMSKNSKFSNGKNVRKGRILGKENTELEFMLPVDLEEKLKAINIKDNEPLVECGVMIHRIEDTQTITFRDTRADGVMGIGTAIFDCDRVIIGIIGYIFGKLDNLFYQVICKDEVTCDRLRAGYKLFCAPGASGAFFQTEAKVAVVDDDNSIEFSDDEKEEEYKRQMALQTDTPRQQWVVPSEPRARPGRRGAARNHLSAPRGYFVPPPSCHGCAPILPRFMTPWNMAINTRVPPPTFFNCDVPPPMAPPPVPSLKRNITEE